MSGLKIGISGYMGAGKSTVSAVFAERGFYLIDADKEAKLLYSTQVPVSNQIVETFGTMVTEKGELSFSKLGSVVFSDSVNLDKLNKIVHPPLLKRLQSIMELNAGKNIVLDAALIPLWNIESWFDMRIWVDSSVENRLTRLLRRSVTLDESQIRSRISIQQHLFQPPSAASWIVFKNDRDYNTLRAETGKLIDRIFEN